MANKPNTKANRYIKPHGGDPAYYNDKPGKVVLVLKNNSNQYLVVKPIDGIAEKKLLKWFPKYEAWKIAKTDGVEVANPFFSLDKILKTGFQLNENKYEAYSLYYELEQATIRDSFPIPLAENLPSLSLEALKVWYANKWQIEKALYLQNSIDKSDIELVLHEINFINDRVNHKVAKELNHFTEMAGKLKTGRINNEIKINSLKAFQLWLISHVEELNSDLTATKADKGKELIKWLGKPSQLGYLFTELVKNGFIELPTTRGDGSYSKLAQLIYDYFEINGAIGTLKNEVNPAKNSLGEISRAKFKIPNIKDL